MVWVAVTVGAGTFFHHAYYFAVTEFYECEVSTVLYGGGPVFDCVVELVEFEFCVVSCCVEYHIIRRVEYGIRTHVFGRHAIDVLPLDELYTYLTQMRPEGFEPPTKEL